MRGREDAVQCVRRTPRISSAEGKAESDDDYMLL